jgi:hypothetical protein
MEVLQEIRPDITRTFRFLYKPACQSPRWAYAVSAKWSKRKARSACFRIGGYGEHAADVADHRQLNAIRRLGRRANDNWVTSRQLKKSVDAAMHLQRTGDGGQSPYLFSISFAAKTRAANAELDLRIVIFDPT